MDTSASGNGTERRGAHWSLCLLGGFDLFDLSRGERVVSIGKRERVLLAFLALSPGCRASRQKLAALLWADVSDQTATDNLRTTVFNLRRALGHDKLRVIARNGEDIVLDATSFEIDALAFRRLAEQTTPHELDAAVKLYSGDFLNGLTIDSEEFETWRREEGTRLRQQVIEILTRLMKLSTSQGDNELAVKAGNRLLQLEPLHEPAVRLLMRIYAQSGRRGAAIDLYRRLSQSLRLELDAEPEAETRSVFASLSRVESTRAIGVAEVELTHSGSLLPHRAHEPRRRRPPARVFAWRAASGISAVVLLTALMWFALWIGLAGRPQAVEDSFPGSSSPA
jgi:DNA-binding SARP family transcriptional activator